MRPAAYRVLMVVALSGWAACAGTVTYFDRGSFTNAAKAVPGVEQEVTFETFTPYPKMFLAFGRSVTISNLTFTGRYLIATRRAPYDETSPSALLNYDAAVPMNLQFESGTRAFGAEFSSQLFPQFTAFTATLSLDNGEIFSFTAPADPEFRFFGFITDQPIYSLTFSDGGIINGGSDAFFHEELIKDIYMVSPVPEPGGLPLLGFGITVFWYCFGRQRGRGTRPERASG